MRITLNGETKDLPNTMPFTLADALTYLEYALDAPIAVAVDGTFVPRSAWDRTLLCGGEAVEVVSPMQGG